MMNKKKIYQEPTYHIIKIRSKLSLLDATEDGPDPAGSARQNDMEDNDDF